MGDGWNFFYCTLSSEQVGKESCGGKTVNEFVSKDIQVALAQKIEAVEAFLAYRRGRQALMFNRVKEKAFAI